MKKIFYSLATLALVFALAGTAYASAVPSDPALFETYLANAQGSTDTTLVLASNVLRDGNTLSGFQCFTLDSNTTTTEYECGTVSGNNVTITLRGIDALTGVTNVSSLQYAHRRGADIKITDYPTLAILARIFQGLDGIATPVAYDSTVSTSSIAVNRNNVVSVGLLDDTAFGGAGVINANTSSRGVVQIATALQTASSTAIGSSGATLVIPTSLATSTFNAATAALRVVVTQNSGKIDSNFIGTIATTTIVGSTNIFAIGKTETVFNAGGNFTFPIPSGVSNFCYQVVGGGGGGGNSTSANAGGGAGGYSSGCLSTTTTMAITVGGAGAAGSSGGNSTIGGVVTANGGATGGGTASPNSSTNGGAGGTATGGQLNITGGNGGDSFFYSTGSFGMTGSGGSNPLGEGGAGTLGRTPNNGNSCGGGGGGNTNNGNNSSGAAGCVIIVY